MSQNRNGKRVLGRNRDSGFRYSNIHVPSWIKYEVLPSGERLTKLVNRALSADALQFKGLQVTINDS